MSGALRTVCCSYLLSDYVDEVEYEEVACEELDRDDEGEYEEVNRDEVKYEKVVEYAPCGVLILRDSEYKDGEH